ncbi:MAG: hypothetical protein ACTS73_05090 [Arsenophonus sp. NEOnobi-MAG3]
MYCERISLTVSPRLAKGYGFLGFWNVMWQNILGQAAATLLGTLLGIENK